MYRFPAARYVQGGRARSVAGTAIDPTTGTALDHSLRVIQSWSQDAEFQVRVDAYGGPWDRGSPHYWDLLLLRASLVAADAVGGRKGSGLGETSIANLNVEGAELPAISDTPAMETLAEKLRAEVFRG